MRAAHTEVKATLSNIHAAQALHMVDNNEYAQTLAAVGVNAPDGTYNFRDAAASASATADAFKLQKAAVATVDKSVFLLYASAKKKLAGCSTANTSNAYDVWCLDHTKLMTNVTTNIGSTCTGTLVDGGAGC